jgi:hypothetical protein
MEDLVISMSARPKPKASTDNCETCSHPKSKHKDILANSMKRCEVKPCDCVGAKEW